MDADYPISDGFLEYVYLLDDKFMPKMIIDSFTSLVWTERYRGYGDFELVMLVDEEFVKAVNLDDYLAIKESNVKMVIESMTLTTDEEEGDLITISGRSLECLLERRIVWDEIKETNEKNFQELVEKILNQNAIAPRNQNRIITGLAFKASSDEKVTGLMTTLESFGDNLYETIDGLCSAKNLGFRVLWDGESMNFELYFGVDRTRSQNTVSPVVFSASYENLLNSDFIQSEINYASNALVKSGESFIMEIYRKPERTGLKRREIYVAVGEPGEGDNTDPTQFAFEEAKKEMAEHTVTVAFGSDVAPMLQFQFGKDYFVGDIVDVENRYGISGRCRIDEVVRSRDEAGPVLTPTFVAVDSENEEVST